MNQQPRIRRIAKWAGLVVCVLIALAWLVSLPWALFYEGDGWWFGWGGGNLSTGPCSAFCGDGWESRVRAESLGDVYWGFNWPRHDSMYWGEITYSGLRFPLWLLLIVVAIPTAILFYRDRRHIPPGHCQKCGYDLTGNLSGRCPECGLACASRK